MVTVQQRGLGKGLSALIPDADKKAHAQPILAPNRSTLGISNVELNRLIAGKFQPRTHFDDTRLEELAQSIQKNGIMQPILVRPAPDKPHAFEIIAGERRWRAAKRAGLKQVPVIIRDLEDSQSLELALIENIQRQDLNPIEEAEGYRQLIDAFGYTQEKLASTVGKSRSHITNLLRVLGLSDKIKSYVTQSKISLGHAKALLTSHDPEALAEMILRKGLNVRQAEKLAKEGLNADLDVAKKPANRAGQGRARPIYQGEKDPDVIALEQTLTENLGLNVAINDAGGQQGEVVIHYESLTQLDEVLKRLGGGI